MCLTSTCSHKPHINFGCMDDSFPYEQQLVKDKQICPHTDERVKVSLHTAVSLNDVPNIVEL